MKKNKKMDGKLIALKQKHERQYWKKRLDVSIIALTDAVRAVGRSVKRVRAYIATWR